MLATQLATIVGGQCTRRLWCTPQRHTALRVDVEQCVGRTRHSHSGARFGAEEEAPSVQRVGVVKARVEIVARYALVAADGAARTRLLTMPDVDAALGAARHYTARVTARALYFRRLLVGVVVALIGGAAVAFACVEAFAFEAALIELCHVDLAGCVFFMLIQAVIVSREC